MPTALIADDEPLLLAELNDLLQEAWPELSIVARAQTGAEALRLLGETKPDVAFLDIEMPRLSGIEIAAMARDVRIVFVTAHERYAVDAFERGASDYLLKPLTPARLGLAVQRLKGLISAPATPLRFVQAWTGNTMRVMAVDEVVAFISGDKHTRVVADGLELLLRRSLVDLVTDLNGDLFWPVSRGTVINARFIEHIERNADGDLQVRMASMPNPLVVSRAHRGRFRGM